MSSPENQGTPEIPVSLTPQQAASGTVLRLPPGTGVPPVRIPPVRDGDVVRLRTADGEVRLRIRVTASPAAAGSEKKQGLACLGVLGVVAVVVLLLVLTNHGGGSDDASDDTAGSSSYSPSYPTATATDEPYTGDPYSSDPYSSAPDTGSTYSSDPYGTGDPYGTPSPDPSPYTSGTCLNGTLPDSTTAQSVSGVEEVSCSASDAHYKVIETIPLTSDMSRCNDNPRTQYAFSSRYTINGATVNEYVYCLVGLGSYAR
ncbi:LppU/SCO3897 family protein [Streptomyces sp. NPDC001135]